VFQTLWYSCDEAKEEDLETLAVHRPSIFSLEIVKSMYENINHGPLAQRGGGWEKRK